jgi:hypothetical protein
VKIAKWEKNRLGAGLELATSTTAISKTGT